MTEQLGIPFNPPTFRRVLVCGGRNYSDWDYLKFILDAAHKSFPINCIIHGCAAGADSLADRWARENNVSIERYPADWEKYGKRAGPIRNLEMLSRSHPDMVIAFPGGSGTAHMKRIAEAHGVHTVTVERPF